MSDETVENSTIRKYLLGDLPELEAERIERWYFAGGQAVDDVWATFGELAEERLSGALSEDEAQKFERRLRSSPALLEMFENEKAIHDYAARNATTTSRQVKSDDSGAVGRRPWKLPALFFRSPRLVAPGVVALIALGAFGLWLALRAPAPPATDGAQQAKAQDQKDSNSVTQPKIDPRQQPRAVGEANERLTDGKKVAIAEPNKSKPALTADRGTMATLLLLAGGTRGGDSSPKLEIPSGAKTVQLEIEPPNDSCDVFSAVLQTESGEEIQRWGRLQARSAYSTLRLARMLVQAGPLKNAGYVVKVECGASSKNSASNAEYRFNVEKK
jgi:hypothetical protein